MGLEQLEGAITRHIKHDLPRLPFETAMASLLEALEERHIEYGEYRNATFTHRSYDWAADCTPCLEGVRGPAALLTSRAGGRAYSRSSGARRLMRRSSRVMRSRAVMRMLCAAGCWGLRMMLSSKGITRLGTMRARLRFSASQAVP